MRASFAGSWTALLVAVAVPAAAGPAGRTDLPPLSHDSARASAQLQLAGAPARRPPASRAQVAIIIDDLGEQHHAGLRAIELPGAVAVAFLPNGAFTRVQADYAHRRGKEILLHLPLQPGNNARAHPAALRADSKPEQVREVLRAALDAVPHASGVNNHQGSLMTELAGPMDELMRELALRPGIYFVDSRTTSSSVAYRAARAHGVPSTERNVFLDTLRGEAAVRQAFEELVVKALRNERALAIGHPYPETLKVLAEELPKLERYGINLVTPSELIARQSGLRGPFRPLKLSPALTLATTPGLPGPPAATSSLAH